MTPDKRGQADRGYWRRAAAIGLGGVSVVAMLALPVLGQESLLPPGFDEPPAKAAPSPAPGASPAPRPAPGPSTPAPRPAPPPGTTPTPPPIAVAPDGTITSAPADTGETAAPPPPPRYDLPPGSRRLLTRVGPLTEDTGSLPANAFGARGLYAAAVMDDMRGPVVSRWSSILLRRALLSAVDTPDTINGADFVAARAWLLTRQGEAQAARMLVQSVDIDKTSARLRNVAMQVYLANADPAGLCPYVPAMAGRGDDAWDLAQAMCAALVGESGTAGAILERVRRRGRLPAIDVKLAEKVIGAGINSRRRAVVQWDGVARLTPWRFGLATATGVEIPDSLWAEGTPAMQRWAVQAPMIPLPRRIAFAREAARGGVLSSRGYADLVSWAADRQDADPAMAEAGRTLRAAFVASDLGARTSAVTALASGNNAAYSGRVLGARAAARIGPVDLDDDRTVPLLEAMFAGGLDQNAMAWTPRVMVGSRSWGLLTVGSPRPLAEVTRARVGDYAEEDDSAERIRSRFLGAALIGLGRVSQADAQAIARDLSLGLGAQTRWTRAIATAADRGEAGMVALLAAAGLQSRDWSGIPPYHLYQITRALSRVGLEAEARMIAAEALSRV